jgi:hypothetical protein
MGETNGPTFNARGDIVVNFQRLSTIEGFPSQCTSPLLPVSFQISWASARLSEFGGAVVLYQKLERRGEFVVRNGTLSWSDTTCLIILRIISGAI